MINILIVDDHALVREGLRRIIDETPGIHVSAEASTGEEALNLIWKGKYDLVLLDISMPGKNGLQILKEIKKYNWHRILDEYGWEKLPKKWISKLIKYSETYEKNSQYGYDESKSSIS